MRLRGLSLVFLVIIVLGCSEQPEPTLTVSPTPTPELVQYRACADCGNAWLEPNPEGVLHETVFEPAAISRALDSLSTGCAIVGARIHRRSGSGQRSKAARRCSSESGIMVL